MRHCLAVFVLITATAACAAAPRERPIGLGPVDTGAGSLTAARKYLEGRWSLTSFDVYPPGGAPIRLNGSGTLVYDAYSNLQMEIRTDQPTADLLRRAGIATENGTISTSGRVVVDMPARTLTYVLEGQPAATSPAGPLAASRPRHWQVDGDVLTLTTKDESGKPLSVGQWKKVR